LFLSHVAVVELVVVGGASCFAQMKAWTGPPRKSCSGDDR
jgi:hypothetical protein